ncbi:flavin reductase family protein [Sediminibacillus albus]|uniref:NADH-FMN oxidoreductase RutF, flavin reductase (DIM6/NTAB) family n=1 Tax=Sediminibacillus albus TaxID=407036 RepID=A0A1G8ZYU0_9BACI|nr:flavin reductase family protein [Sediminibacillus albus]SDK20151.1 NADH-FMN oxidoreductase RutF, flavin reductase (DIM6/NTAB) family [Sediminibacillus albus]
MKIDIAQFKHRNMSKLVKGAVVPRPIAWVSSISGEGVRNLAPFSFFTVASMDPITLCFSVGGAEKEKDTLANIKASQAFVVNIVSEKLANQMYETSKSYPAETDEFAIAGLDAEPGERVKVPRVKLAPVQMECQLDRIVEVGNSSLVLGRLVCYHINDEIYEEVDKVNPDKLSVIGRMAGDYAFTREFFELTDKKFHK